MMCLSHKLKKFIEKWDGEHKNKKQGMQPCFFID